MKYLYLILLAFLVSSCQLDSPPEEKELHNRLQGTFTSTAQSQQDSSYYDITINLAAIWEEKEDLWIYAEQALSNAVHNPYSQKIYKVSRDNNQRLLLESYVLENFSPYKGAWKTPYMFDSLSPGHLLPEPGCAIFFKKEDKTFIGETEGKECRSLTANSQYSSNRLAISQDKLVSWGRGFDKENNQVWGKTDSGYILQKLQ